MPQPFLDWYGVWAGQVGIEGGQVWVQDPPVGVRLAVQEASKSSVFIAPEHPWEAGGLTPQAVLCDDGVLKMWYIARGAGDDQPPFIAYAESADGFCWQRPALHLQEYDGSTANNLLFRFGDFGLQSVFVDPVAPPEARYKAMARDSITYHDGAPVPAMTRERKWAIRRAMKEAGYTPEQRAAACISSACSKVRCRPTASSGPSWRSRF